MVKLKFEHISASYLSPECRERELTTPCSLCNVSAVQGQASGDDETTGAWWEEESDTLDW